MKEFKYKIGDAVINRWNWHFIIVYRYKSERGINCYIVENNEDPFITTEDVDDPIWNKNWHGVQREWEIRRLDN